MGNGRDQSANKQYRGAKPAGNRYGKGNLSVNDVRGGERSLHDEYPDVDALDQFVNNEVNGNPGGGLGTGLGDQGLGKELSYKKREVAPNSRIADRERERCKSSPPNLPTAKNRQKPAKNAIPSVPKKDGKKLVNPFKKIEVSDSSDEEDEEKKIKNEKKRGYKADLDLMKTTLKIENEGLNLAAEEVLDYQEKVDDVLELHDEILAMHMNILKVGHGVKSLKYRKMLPASHERRTSIPGLRTTLWTTMSTIICWK